MHHTRSHFGRFLRTACLLLTVLNTITVAVFTGAFLHMRRSVEPVYAEMLDGQELPAFTALLLAMPAALFIGAAALVAAALIAKDFIRPKAAPLVINLLWVMVGACIGCLILIGLLYPMWFIIEDVTSGAL